MFKNFNLKTKRLFLRPISVRDLESVWPFVTDSSIAKYMSWEPHQKKEETIVFLERLEENFANSKGITWAIFFDGEFCGIISIISILINHRSLIYKRGELAYWLGRQFQGQGIMTEAGEAVIQYAFNDLDLHRLIVSHFTINSSSEKLIKRLGFRYIGEENDAFQKQGVWHNHKLYELINPHHSPAN